MSPDASFSIRYHRADGSIHRHPDCPACRRIKRLYDESRRAGFIAPVDREGTTRLDIAPWRGWLDERVQAEGMSNLAARLGVTECQVKRWRCANAFADLDKIDAALCRARETAVLRQLYPDLWDLPPLEDELEGAA